MGLHADLAAFNMTSGFLFHEAFANTLLREPLSLWKATFFFLFFFHFLCFMILNRSSQQVLREKQKVRGRSPFDNLPCPVFVKQSQMLKEQVPGFKLTGQLYLLCSASLFINSQLRDWKGQDGMISRVKERSAMT